MASKNIEVEYAVFIGRFQPFHKAHQDTVRFGLQKAQNIIIVLGSYQTAPTIKNPWNVEDREKMIRACFTADENVRIACVPIRDYFYRDALWISDVQQKVRAITDDSESVALIGQFSDESSYYLSLFPQWQKLYSGIAAPMHATQLRKCYFEQSEGWEMELSNNLPEPVVKFLAEFKKTPKFNELVIEHKYISDYKAKWTSAPFTPSFNTADAVVIQSGHVLVVRRKGFPGKGCLALPGGFVQENETVFNAALRELKEETRIKVPLEVLKRYASKPVLFDYPGRSLRGRTFTHAVLVTLPDSAELPEVRGGDDAAKAFWLPYCDVFQNHAAFFEDHAQIVQIMLATTNPWQ